MVIQYRSLGSSATLKSSSFYFYVPSESDYSCGGLVSFYDVVFYCDFFCYTECFFSLLSITIAPTANWLNRQPPKNARKICWKSKNAGHLSGGWGFNSCTKMVLTLITTRLPMFVTIRKRAGLCLADAWKPSIKQFNDYVQNDVTWKAVSATWN